MTDNEMRIAIAEACGLFGFETRNGVLTGWIDMEKPGIPVPDYLNDLNAMHEAEKTLSSEENQLYANLLARELCASVKWTFHATARQRAEAFLRTKVLWK